LKGVGKARPDASDTSRQTFSASENAISRTHHSGLKAITEAVSNRRNTLRKP
jgi:hypothetical protein